METGEGTEEKMAVGGRVVLNNILYPFFGLVAVDCGFRV